MPMRGAVIPGGVRRDLAPIDPSLREELARLHGRIRDDERRAMRTPSFLDRIRGTGVLDPGYAAEWGLLGPIGRASGQHLDIRWAHPSDGYRGLRLPSAPAVDRDGDARARQRVRWEEIEVAFGLVEQAIAALADADPGSDDSGSDFVGPDPADGLWIGSAEAPQGEVLYAVSFRGGVVSRCFARSASLHDLVAFHDAFRADVFTDFAFIEASFGLGYAGVAM